VKRSTNSACASRAPGLTVKMDDNTDFRDWLRERMDELGLTPAALADKSGASASNARNWYVGANKPDWQRCYYIAKALGVAVEEVRERAGFIDPPEEATERDALLDDLLAKWPELSDEDRHMLVRLAGLQFGSPRRQRRA
jgi:transcriptional regulator with XRE-family HTH domain